MNGPTRNALPALLALLVVQACSVAVTNDPPAPTASASRGEGQGRGRGKIGVPPGHYPPPGQCRLWYEGRPPGRQPRAGSCDRVIAEAPAGATVLYRPTSDRRVIHQRVIDPVRVGVVISIIVFDAESGDWLRDERP